MRKSPNKFGTAVTRSGFLERFYAEVVVVLKLEKLTYNFQKAYLVTTRCVNLGVKGRARRTIASGMLLSSFHLS